MTFEKNVLFVLKNHMWNLKFERAQELRNVKFF